jgi:hypothetical protein
MASLAKTKEAEKGIEKIMTITPRPSQLIHAFSLGV